MASEEELDINDYYFDELLDISEFGDRAYYEELRKAQREREKLANVRKAEEAKEVRKQIERKRCEFEVSQ